MTYASSTILNFDQNRISIINFLTTLSLLFFVCPTLSLRKLILSFSLFLFYLSLPHYLSLIFLPLFLFSDHHVHLSLAKYTVYLNVLFSSFHGRHKFSLFLDILSLSTPSHFSLLFLSLFLSFSRTKTYKTISSLTYTHTRPYTHTNTLPFVYLLPTLTAHLLSYFFFRHFLRQDQTFFPISSSLTLKRINLLATHPLLIPLSLSLSISLPFSFSLSISTYLLYFSFTLSRPLSPSLSLALILSHL